MAAEAKTESLTEANKRVFDQLATSYGLPDWHRKVSEVVMKGLRDRVEWMGLPKERTAKEVRLLDYACGTGLVSHSLEPYITSATGIDLAPGMVTRYNTSISSANYPIPMTARVGDLCSPDKDPSLADLKDFDLAVIGLGFHHFENRDLAVRRLVSRLRPGGTLVIVDLIAKGTDSGDSGPYRETISVSGFTEEGMREMFADAGLVGFGFDVLEEKVALGDKGIEKEIFFAKGTKKAE